MNWQIKVRGIALLDGKLLCVQLKPYSNNTTAELGPFWCLPGGGVDDNEPIPDAFRREMTEELGVEPEIGRLLYVQQFTHKNMDFLEFFFHIENASDYTNVDLEGTTHGAQEIAKVAFIDPKKEGILPKFLASEDLPGFIASNQPTKFFANH